MLGRTGAITVALLLAACTSVERRFDGSRVTRPEVVQAAVPVVGEQGEFAFTFPMWGSLEEMQAIKPGGAAPPSAHVLGRFEVVEVVRDPSSWSCEVDMAFVRVRMLDGDHAGTTGWVFAVGPYLAPGPSGQR